MAKRTVITKIQRKVAGVLGPRVIMLLTRKAYLFIS